MSAEENKAVARRYLEELDKGNLDIIDEILANDYVGHIAGYEDIHGPAAQKEIAASFKSAFPDFQHNIEDIITEGDKVVLRLADQGTHKGELMGIAPTGKQVSFTAIAIFRITGGKLSEGWINFDALSMMQQIGAVNLPK